MASTKRFVGVEKAKLLSMIDLDTALWIEYDDGTKAPIALVETAQDRGQSIKPTTVLRHLAERARIAAYVVLYTISERDNPSSPQYRDVERFRVRRVWPNAEEHFMSYSPQQWAERLLQIREAGAKHTDGYIERIGA
jgi:hypothetical protein